MKRNVEVLKKIVEREYIYIYMNKVVYADVNYEGHIDKNNCCGTIIAGIQKSCNSFIIEVVDDKEQR